MSCLVQQTDSFCVIRRHTSNMCPCCVGCTHALPCLASGCALCRHDVRTLALCGGLACALAPSHTPSGRYIDHGVSVCGQCDSHGATESRRLTPFIEAPIHGQHKAVTTRAWFTASLAGWRLVTPRSSQE